MSPTHFKVKSLSGKIFSSVAAFSLAVVLAFGVAMTSIYYYSHERSEEDALVALAGEAAECLDALSAEDRISALQGQFAGTVRYTLIAADGEVLFDSAADEDSMENHAQRPEVEQAETQGASQAVRYSETLGTDTIYAAVRLDDGGIVRLSETRESFPSFLGGMLVPILVALVLVGIAVLFLSRALVRRIMKPIDALDFADPLENEIYEEMDPLLERIDEQQKQLKQQNEELAAAENMRRDFSSNVSHEMKTPLQVISGYAELMKNDMVQPADRQKFAALIYEEAQAMRSLINDVLTLSHLDEASCDFEANRPVDVVAVGERMAGRLGSFAAEAGVKVQVEGERGTCFIVGSETLVEEMLYNLIENGIRYNHEGGRVRLSVSLEGGKVCVRVSDTGPGIPAEYRDKVFERFFRVDKSRSKETGGTGLGLAIVKHAVIYHNGTIEVESEEGAGTTFVVHLPAASQ